MIQVEITEEMRVHAIKKAEQMGTLNNSIMNGKGNAIGFLGEEVARELIGGKEHNTFQFDFYDPRGHAVEVKTKLCSSKPQPHYDCTVSGFNSTQECDYYAFVRILNDYKTAWVLGSKIPQEYYGEARHYQKGDRDESNNFTFRSEAFNLRISDLDEIIQKGK